MTTTRKRGPRRTHSAGAQPQQQPRSISSPPGLPEWRWRTFPVYFAFALGAFLAAYVGVIAGIAQ